MDNIKDKIVLVTGGASGIGYAYAEELLRNGAKSVALLDLSTSPGKNAVATLEKEFGKGRAIFVVCDVTNAELFKESFQKVIDTLGGLDIVINNAGMLNDRLWEQTIALNVNSLIRGSLLAVDHMGKHKGGKGGIIVNIASIVGLAPAVFLPVYTATKHAVVGFSRSLQASYDKTGVRVLTMCPGVTMTNLFGVVEERTFDFADEELVQQEFQKYPTQETDNVARAMIQLIQKGKNGAIWVSEGNQPPYAVEIPHYSKMTVPM